MQLQNKFHVAKTVALKVQEAKIGRMTHPWEWKQMTLPMKLCARPFASPKSKFWVSWHLVMKIKMKRAFAIRIFYISRISLANYKKKSSDASAPASRWPSALFRSRCGSGRHQCVGKFAFSLGTGSFARKFYAKLTLDAQ